MTASTTLNSKIKTLTFLIHIDKIAINNFTKGLYADWKSFHILVLFCKDKEFIEVCSLVSYKFANATGLKREGSTIKIPMQ